MSNHELIITQTKNWIRQVVIGCNFCPFAAKEMKRNSVHYEIENSISSNEILKTLEQECERLNNDKSIATTFIILPDGVKDFDAYLKLVKQAERFLKKNNYEGIYQLASFHPDYCFADSPADDAANFTNRSVYPMLHLLREKDIELALKNYPEPENIPANNILFARKKGNTYMQMMRDACL